MFSGVGNPAGVKRDSEASEKCRLQAVRLLARGMHQAEVARRLGVHQQSVSRWARKWAAAGRAGRKAGLSFANPRRLEEGLKRRPEALGYSTGLWTERRAAELIQRQCGVEYHPAYV